MFVNIYSVIEKFLWDNLLLRKFENSKNWPVLNFLNFISFSSTLSYCNEQNVLNYGTMSDPLSDSYKDWNRLKIYFQQAQLYILYYNSSLKNNEEGFAKVLVSSKCFRNALHFSPFWYKSEKHPRKILHRMCKCNGLWHYKS